MNETEKVLIPEISTSVAVAAIRNPFEPEAVKFRVPEGSSIADILVGMGLPAAIPARIFIDDRIVLKHDREETRPHAGEFVTIRVQPEGGGGNNKGEMAALEALVVIAAAAATWYVGGSGGLVAGAGMSATLGSTAAGAAVGANVSILGRLAVRASIL